MRRATSRVIAEKFHSDILNRLGTSKVLTADNVRNLISSLFKSLTDSFGVEILNTPFYHSQVNLVGKLNRNIK